MNLCMLLDMAADGFGSRTVIGTRAAGFTVAQLRALSIGGAEKIRSAGADSLIYLEVNGPAFPVAMFAAARADVPLIPINYRLSAEQLVRQLARHPKAIGIADRRSHSLFAELGIPVLTAGEWLEAAASLTGSEDAEDEPAAPAVMIYTSGTTSEPKGVMLRHHNLVSYVLGSVEFGNAGEDDASLVSVPPYHIAAVANAITNLYAGRRCIVLEQFTGQQWLDLVRAEGVTHALVVPTMLARILAAESDLAVPSLRSLAYGGAAMPAFVVERALETWPHVDFINAYGLTETSSTIAVLGPDEHRAAVSSTDPAIRARLTSAGLAVPGIEIEIRDEAGQPQPPMARGRIWVRGQQVSGEYAGIGSVLDEDGFFDTRDEGYLDREDYLFIGGRTDDTIIRGGENIAPAEIEETLIGHPDVADAVVVGVPDPEWGQRLEAAVVAEPGRQVDPEAVRAYVRTRVRSSRTPDRILVWDDLPRTETGKLVRRHALDRILGPPGALCVKHSAASGQVRPP
jgi:acyl-CoA synthetase (AMP-forming)/AMP-acid ligase II